MTNKDRRTFARLWQNAIEETLPILEKAAHAIAETSGRGDVSITMRILDDGTKIIIQGENLPMIQVKA